MLRNAFRDVILNPVWSSAMIPTELRWLALSAFGMDVKKSAISFGGWFGSRRVSIGRRTYINSFVYFDSSEWIRIGDDVSIGPHVRFYTSTHQMGTREKRAGHARSAPIFVGSGSWIGAASIILPGVRVGSGTVIAAGSVVNSDCEPDSLYAGVPARLVRRLGDEHVIGGALK